MCTGNQRFWLVFGVRRSFMQPYLLSTNAKCQKWPALPKTPCLCHSWFSFFIFKVVHLCLTVLPSTLHISKCLSQLFASCVASVSLRQYFCFPLSGSCLYVRFWLLDLLTMFAGLIIGIGWSYFSSDACSLFLIYIFIFIDTNVTHRTIHAI